MQMPRGGSYVETRSCHYCKKQGHLKQYCKEFMDQTMSKDSKVSQATNQLVLQTADPLPVVHQDGSVHWQGDPVVAD